MFRKAVLFIHGFSGNYYENEYCINYLERFWDLDVYTFTLPGHEAPIMKKVAHEKWMEYSEEMLVSLFDTYDTIYLIGHSMGGVIASHLASVYPDHVKKLVLIAPAFLYGSFKQNKEDLKKIFDKEEKEEGKSGYAGLFTKLVTVPLTRILEFTKLVKEYRESIGEVTCPTLILQGDIDNIVPLESSYYAYERLKKHKYMTIFEGVRHQVFLTSRREEICQYIHLFLKSERQFKKEYQEKL